MSQTVALTVLAVSAAALALAAAASFFVLLSVARRLARAQGQLERLIEEGGEALSATRRAAAGVGQELAATGQALRGFLVAGALASLATRYLVRRWRSRTVPAGIRGREQDSLASR